jgi:hypothetical protein
MASRIEWGRVLERAAAIVDSYETGVTLRQLFYRLVSDQTLPNTTSAYKNLSRTTAEARRDGWFPALIDRGRIIHRDPSWSSPAHALRALAEQYRVDRTAGQQWSIYLAVEKAGIVEQLSAWFSDLGVPILATGGYSSQTYVDEVNGHAARQERPAVLLYAGDFDPSGEDIDRDFTERSNGAFDEVVRVALSAEQVESYGLPENPGKTTDARAGGFVARHGRLVQVELDALDPVDLQQLYADAIEDYWDDEIAVEVIARENEDVSQLEALADEFAESQTPPGGAGTEQGGST